MPFVRASLVRGRAVVRALPVGWAVRWWTALNPPVCSFAGLIEEQHGAG
ncbi:hypothetical protein [Streptomyces albidoflavus]